MANKNNDRLPAAQLKQAQPEHFKRAIERLLAGDVEHPFGPSTGYDLHLDDGTTLPPKAVFGLALSEALGRRIEPKHFFGGERSTCCGQLRKAGYKIERKKGLWALLANPKHYRIEDAVAQLETDLWGTAGKAIRKGDRIIIWKAKGGDRVRGVVALGEVLSDPAELPDAKNPFWTQPPTGKAPRVRIRYDALPGLPLWLSEHAPLLDSLSVARARGGSIFKLDASEWAAIVAAAGIAPTPSSGELGADYKKAAFNSSGVERNPFEVDAEKVERGNQGHADTQNALAAFLTSRGIAPRSPGNGEPAYDLAWEAGDRPFVAEVKSTTATNEEKQLRLGLGQVLRYRHLMSRAHPNIRAVLVAEQQPADPSWRSTCHDVGVQLVWPAAFGELATPE